MGGAVTGAEQARENARRPDGRFGTQPGPEAEGGFTALTGRAAWQDQRFLSEGKTYTLGQVSDQNGTRRGLFHASITSLPIGTVLVPQPRERRNFSQSPGKSVSVTSDPLWANMWGRRAARSGEHVYVYQVEPLDRVSEHNTMPHGESVIMYEGRTGSARIVGVVDVGAVRQEIVAIGEEIRAEKAQAKAQNDVIESMRMSDDGGTYLAPDGRVLTIEDNGDGSEYVSCDGEPVGLVRAGRGEPNRAGWQIAIMEDEGDDIEFQNTPYLASIPAARTRAIRLLAERTEP